MCWSTPGRRSSARPSSCRRASSPASTSTPSPSRSTAPRTRSRTRPTSTRDWARTPPTAGRSPATTAPRLTGRVPDDVVTMDKVVALCKRRGFIFAASDIYGGIANTYDYGHYGVLLKNNVVGAWWKAMIQERDDIVALDSAIIQHPRTWEASGHLAGFSDPLVECRTCNLRFRADHLQEVRDGTAQHEGISCGRAPSKLPGDHPDCDLTEAREFNLRFETSIGPVKDAGSTVYLRPETAQGIFLAFKTTLQYARKKPPFGIAQIGKSFRNEITPGNFVFRTLEFEQMEMEYFVPPEDAEKWHAHWMDARMDWYAS